MHQQKNTVYFPNLLKNQLQSHFQRLPFVFFFVEKLVKKEWRSFVVFFSFWKQRELQVLLGTNCFFVESSASSSVFPVHHIWSFSFSKQETKQTKAWPRKSIWTLWKKKYLFLRFCFQGNSMSDAFWNPSRAASSIYYNKLKKLMKIQGVAGKVVGTSNQPTIRNFPIVQVTIELVNMFSWCACHSKYR